MARQPIVIDPLNPRWLWTASAPGVNAPALVRASTDGGETWKPLTTPDGIGSQFWGGSAAHVPGQPARVQMWSATAIVESLDGGSSWAVVKPVNPLGKEGWLQAVEYEGDGKRMFSLAAYGGTLTSSTDPNPRNCNQRHRFARRVESRGWQIQPEIAVVPWAETVWLSSLSRGPDSYGVLVEAFPTKQDCADGTPPKYYFVTYTG
jgi:hypothetical protein